VAGRAWLLGLLVLSVFVGGASATSTRTLALPGPVAELAADGGRVAILLRAKGGECPRDRVAVWTPSSRSFAPIGASACVGSTSTGAGLFGVALAGTRVAYVQFAGGNARELQLRLAGLSRPRPVTVASAAFGLDEGQGTYIGRVAGDRSLLAFDWWSLCRPCAAANPSGPRGALWRVVPTGSACPQSGGLGALPRCRVVTSLAGSLRLLDAEGGLVAYRVGDDFVAVRTAAGEPMYSGVFPGVVRAARLEGGGLLVLTRDATKKNSLWGVDTHISDGRRSGPFPLPSSKSAGGAVCGDPSGCRPSVLRLEDYHEGVVVYAVGRDVHLLRLGAERRDVRIRAPGIGPAHAQLEAPGLFYSYRPAKSPGRGRVAFMPMAAVRALFR
jgi:hypothetical protein